jgi:hypothetical protein
MADRMAAARSGMSGIDTLPPLREVIAAHGLFGAQRRWGRTFLLDLNLTAKIARVGGGSFGADVLEVGPGPGGLTRGLLAEGARRVVAVEKDARCLPALAEIAEAYPGRLEVVEGDALALDWAPHLTPADQGGGQPALQRRHRAFGALADARPHGRPLVKPDADVPARGGRADRGPARQPRPMGRLRSSRNGAARRGSPVDAAARGLHPAAQGPPRPWCI